MRKRETKRDKESEREGSLVGRNFMGLLLQPGWNFGLRSVPHSLSRRALIKSQRRQISLTRFGHFRYLGPRPHTGCVRLARSCIYSIQIHRCYTYVHGRRNRRLAISKIHVSLTLSLHSLDLHLLLFVGPFLLRKLSGCGCCEKNFVTIEATIRSMVWTKSFV